ncbi:hypothetical protein DUNSADRAFT_4781 [Dunaliella salina]|uniref:Encoded protein n=1 Tax=Dunaliella salina TaxID=3046 RepID=A0ABQ7GRD1_DUNSA|nr:hypothetical protein DUNSADRAFT_4781 [Dunaliella salina]|eukprot:KAF5837160.1 hypothetical protein DUNSADRAFT_4781 [Dunaliella salina]
MQGSTSSEGGPPLPPNSAAAAPVVGGTDTLQEAQGHAPHMHAPQGGVHASSCQTDPKSSNGSSCNAAEVGMPSGGEGRGIRRAGSQSEPGEFTPAPSSTRGNAPTQGTFSRSCSGLGSNEQLGSGRMGSAGEWGVGEGRGRFKSFHGDRGGAEMGVHAPGSVSAEGGVPSTTTAPPAAPRQRQIVRRPNRPNTPTATNTSAATAAPSQSARTAHSAQEQQQQQQLPPHFLSSNPDAPPLSSSNPSSHASPVCISRPGTPVLPPPPPMAIPPTPAPSQALSSDLVLCPPYPSSAPSRPGSALHQPSPLHATTFDTTVTTTAADAAPQAMQHQQHQHQHQQRRGVRSSCSSGAIEAMLGGAEGAEGVCSGDCDSRAPSEPYQQQQQQHRQQQQ